jgi:hypothetical protein
MPSTPGVAVPGTVVAINSLTSPGGAQGIAGTTPGPSANANNKATLGSDSLILVQGTASGVAATTHAQTVSGDDPQLTNARTPSVHAATHLVSGSDPILANFANQRTYFDDFLGQDGVVIANGGIFGAAPWKAFIAGTGAAVQNDSTYATAAAKGFGCIQLVTGTTATGAAGINADYLYPGLGALELDFRILASAAPTISQNYLLQLGIADDASTHFVGIQIYFSASAIVVGQSNNGSTVTSTASAAFTAGVFHRYQILINSAWTSISFFQDGVQIGSAITTNIPTTTKMCLTLSIGKTAGTTSVFTNIDQFYLNYVYTS